jgi:hypothetical protein
MVPPVVVAAGAAVATLAVEVSGLDRWGTISRGAERSAAAGFEELRDEDDGPRADARRLATAASAAARDDGAAAEVSGEITPSDSVTAFGTMVDDDSGALTVAFSAPATEPTCV